MMRDVTVVIGPCPSYPDGNTRIVTAVPHCTPWCDFAMEMALHFGSKWARVEVALMDNDDEVMSWDEIGYWDAFRGDES